MHEPTPAIEESPSRSAIFDRCMYHKVPPQSQRQITARETIGNRDAGGMIAVPAGGHLLELAAAILRSVAGLQPDGRPLMTAKGRLDLAEAGDHQSSLVGEGKRLQGIA